MPSKVRRHPEEDSKKKNRESSKGRNEETSEYKKGQRRDGVKFPRLNIGLGELHKKIIDSLPIPRPLFEDTKGTETLEEGKTEISFTNADFDGVYRPHNDVIVILSLIGMYKVRHVLIDTGRSISVIFSGAYSSMNLNEGQVEADDNPIVGFSGETVSAVGRVNLPTTVGGKTVMQYFSLLDCRAPYNSILGRDWINSMEEKGKEGPPTIERLIEVQIGDQEEHTTYIGAKLPEEERESLISLLKENKYVFAWSLKDIPGIDPTIACHRLDIRENYKPVRQKPCKMAPERKANVAEEIERMLEAGIIRPVRYPKWMENIIVVPKKNGKIRVCIDFTNFNKACPSDPYLLPRIPDLVDATSGYERLSFMDGYSGYNQIPLHKDDQEHTAFVTDKGVYCCVVMPFGLKNARGTYQRLVNEMFKDMIGKI
ncbi:uncharacterized protein LOC113316206 [Papaver somniferum]|uniref:uncharacterized protein LOC113316206 n=1 Tax=Papaver somniferum TaxID=3469 RepID=UPI000E6FE998|nr:uncharacterized protein LOC113316206 [Papaver somniferum]